MRLLSIFFSGFFLLNLFIAEVLAYQGKRADFELIYTAKILEIPAGTKELKLWIPYPQSDGDQEIYSLKIDSSYPSFILEDKDYANKFLYFVIKDPAQNQIEINLNILASRYEVKVQGLPQQSARKEEIGPLQRKLYLESNLDEGAQRSSLQKIVDRLLRGKKTDFEKMKALYDYVYSQLEYSKEIPGYGSGDVSRVCLVKSGNCIDFHSLFVALASCAGLTAREVANIDIPIEDKTVNYCKANYHCNAEVFLPGYGWFPLDISHAKKARKGRQSKDFYFGGLDNLRLKLGHGRNIQLPFASQSREGLKRLGHEPYVEIDGKSHHKIEVSVFAHLYDAASTKSYATLISPGEKARSFKYPDLDNRSINLEDYLGKKLVLLNFFATWCGRCNWETPVLVKLYSEYQPRGVEFIRINVMEKKEKVEDFKKSHGMTFPVLADESAEVSRLYGIKYVPANILIDKQGQIRFAGHLLGEEDLRRRLEELLGETQG